jgi:ketosteroid isomerase-like protein
LSHSAERDDVHAIHIVAKRWAKAIAGADLQTLACLMAEDIVVVHGNGRCVSGRQAVLADLASSLNTFRVTLNVLHEETVVAGPWAFDRARVTTSVVRLQSGDTQRFMSHTWTILRRNASTGWSVARVMGVLEMGGGEPGAAQRDASTDARMRRG